MPLTDPWDNTAPVARDLTLDDAFDNTGPTKRDGLSPALPGPDEVVEVAATSNLNLAATLDGVTVNGYVLTADARVLCVSQTNPAQNGVYSVVTSPGVPVRYTGLDSAAEYQALRDRFSMFKEQNGTGLGRRWALATPGTIVLGTTHLLFQAAPIAV